jgi:hypothetical protein
MAVPTPEEVGWVDVYETVEFDGHPTTVLRQLVAGNPGFEKSNNRGDGKKVVNNNINTHTATIVLRGSTSTADDDVLESAIDDGMSLIRALLGDRRLVSGAGEMELELAEWIGVWAGEVKGKQRHVVKGFAMALEVIPRTLAENTPRGGEEGVNNQRVGETEAVLPSVDTPNTPPYPILDSLAVKRTAITVATNAAIKVLTIDSTVFKGGSQVQPGTYVLGPYSFVLLILGTFFMCVVVEAALESRGKIGSFFSRYFSK